MTKDMRKSYALSDELMGKIFQDINTNPIKLKKDDDHMYTY